MFQFLMVKLTKEQRDSLLADSRKRIAKSEAKREAKAEAKAQAKRDAKRGKS